MFNALLLTHSWLRWIVLLGGLYTTGRCLHRGFSRLPWRGEDNYYVWAFGRAFLYQGVFGIILYLHAVVTRPARILAAEMDDRLGVPVYWPLVHGVGMLLVLGFFHGAKALVPRFCRRERRAWAYSAVMLVSLGLIFTLVPWPFLRFGRPLARLP